MEDLRTERHVDTGRNIIYFFEDEALFEAMAAATRRVLDTYDDSGLLSQRQPRLVAKIKRVVLGELQREVPERLAARNPWLFIRALGAYITQETRKRQGMAFERRLAEMYGPMESIDEVEWNSRWSFVNGVAIFRVGPPGLEQGYAKDKPVEVEADSSLRSE